MFGNAVENFKLSLAWLGYLLVRPKHQEYNIKFGSQIRRGLESAGTEWG